MRALGPIGLATYEVFSFPFPAQIAHFSQPATLSTANALRSRFKKALVAWTSNSQPAESWMQALIHLCLACAFALRHVASVAHAAEPARGNEPLAPACVDWLISWPNDPCMHIIVVGGPFSLKGLAFFPYLRRCVSCWASADSDPA